MPESTQPANGTTAYRLTRVEACVDRLENTMDAMVRDTERIKVRQENAASDRAEIKAHLGRHDQTLSELEKTVARYSAGAALGGAVIGQVIAYVLSQALR